MLTYGVLDRTTGDVIDLYVSRERAELELAEILGGESRWADSLELVQVDLSGAGPRVTPISFSS